MIITFDNSESAVLAFEILKDCLYEDKKLLGEHFVRKREKKKLTKQHKNASSACSDYAPNSEA